MKKSDGAFFEMFIIRCVVENSKMPQFTHKFCGTHSIRCFAMVLYGKKATVSIL